MKFVSCEEIEDLLLQIKRMEDELASRERTGGCTHYSRTLAARCHACEFDLEQLRRRLVLLYEEAVGVLKKPNARRSRL